MKIFSQISAIFALFLTLSACGASDPHPQSGYYLKWDTDHSERMILPEYKINPETLDQHRAYQVIYDTEGRPKTVKYFEYGVASDSSNFGAHRLVFSYHKDATHRYYYTAEGKQTENSVGVYRETYVKSADGFYSARTHYDSEGNKIADSHGVANYRIITRDQKGRRTAIRHLALDGTVVRDRLNGFLETRFAFDKNDHLLYRRAYDLSGEKALGHEGYHTVYFTYDKQANRLAEEFRDLQDELVIPTGDSFARIELDYQPPFGRVVAIRYFKANGKPRDIYPAHSVLIFDDLGRLIKRTYHSLDGGLANTENGVATYIYSYDSETGARSRKAYSADESLRL